jgi:hypothetical protein
MDCTMAHTHFCVLFCWGGGLLLLFLRQKEAGEMAQWLRALTALKEHQKLVPRNHIRELTTPCISSSRGSDSLFLPLQAPECVVHTNTNRRTHTHYICVYIMAYLSFIYTHTHTHTHMNETVKSHAYEIQGVLVLNSDSETQFLPL